MSPVLSRRALIFGVSGCLAAGGVACQRSGTSPHTSDATSRLHVDPDSIMRGSTEDPVASLTFDDGPDPRFTPDVLRILHNAGVVATFFLIGRSARAHPDLVEQIALAGHEIANHSHDHLWMDDLPADVVRGQIHDGEALFPATRGARGFVRHEVGPVRLSRPSVNASACGASSGPEASSLSRSTGSPRQSAGW